MGLKLKRFKAKLNWKTKTKVPDVVCVRYQITSEFAEEMCISPIAISNISNGIQKNHNLNVANENTTNVRTNYKLDDISIVKQQIKKSLQNKLEPTEINSPETKSNGNIESPSSQPKSILKKSSLPDSEEYKSPLIFMTENHDDEKSKTNSKEENSVLRNIEERKYVEIRPNFDNSESKMVNWRETIEFISLKEGNQESDYSKLPAQNQSESEEEEEEYKIHMNTDFGNGISYSNQAASIFFATEDPKPKQKNKKNSTA